MFLSTLLQLLFNIPFIWLILSILILSNISDKLILNPYILLLFYILGLLFDFLQPLIFGLNILSISMFYLILSATYYFTDLKPSQKQTTKIIILLISLIISYIVTYMSLTIIRINLLNIFLKISIAIFLAWFIIQICKRLN